MESILTHRGLPKARGPQLEFNPVIAKPYLLPEQEKHFFLPLNMSYDEYYARLMLELPKAFRRAGQQCVNRGISVIVLRDIIEYLRKYPMIMVMPESEDSSTWGYACRYRLDAPWYVAAVAGDYTKPTFQSYHVEKVAYYKNLRTFPPLDKFLATGMYGIRQNQESPSWRPSLNFLHGLKDYILHRDWAELANRLLHTDFWPLDDGEYDQLEFTLERISVQDVGALHEATGLCQSLLPSLPSDLKKILCRKETQIWAARSRHAPETILSPGLTSHAASQSNVKPTMLGVLIGGLTQYTDEPCLHTIVVVPDERRRGIASSLIKRFFSQTGYGSVIAKTRMSGDVLHYEAAGLFQSMQAIVEKKETVTWTWRIPSPALSGA